MACFLYLCIFSILKILIYRSVHFIIFSCSHQCLVRLSEFELISPKVKREKGIAAFLCAIPSV